MTGLWHTIWAAHHVSVSVVRSTAASVKTGSASGVVRTWTAVTSASLGTRTRTVTLSPSAGYGLET